MRLGDQDTVKEVKDWLEKKRQNFLRNFLKNTIAEELKLKGLLMKKRFWPS